MARDAMAYASPDRLVGARVRDDDRTAHAMLSDKISIEARLLAVVEGRRERVVRERALQECHRVDEPVRRRRGAGDRCRDDATAEAVSDEMNADGRSVGAETLKRLIHSARGRRRRRGPSSDST